MTRRTTPPSALTLVWCFHSLHDLGIHNGTVAKVACYDGALAITLIAAASLLSLGF